MNDIDQIAENLLQELRTEITRRQLSNAENFDKSVLSLSTAFLGFSLAFLKDIVPYQESSCRFLLPLSWVLFTASIIQTIFSYLVAEKDMDLQLDIATTYYRSKDPEQLKRPNPYKTFSRRLNFGSGLSFMLAVLFTLSFFIINFSKGGNMSGRNLQKASSSPTITPLPNNPKPEVSVVSPTITPLPTTNPGQAPANNQNNQNNQNKSK